jgi:antitoxin HicB
MTDSPRHSLDDYLNMSHSFEVIPEPGGSFFVRFPDLPGCFTEAASPREIAEMAEDARRLWIQVEYERGHEIPAPTHQAEYSGRFNVRLPRSLHRSLADGARREGVSLNQYVVALLSRSDVLAQGERALRGSPPGSKSDSAPSRVAEARGECR